MIMSEAHNSTPSLHFLTDVNVGPSSNDLSHGGTLHTTVVLCARLMRYSWPGPGVI